MQVVPSNGVKVAIVDYGLGNLFSVKHACEYVGMQATVTSSPQELLRADAVILPGVGAFGNAMDSLRRLGLIGPLGDVAASHKPMIGICLGMQLLMTESFEFGRHRGLGIIEGSVMRFDHPVGPRGRLKVPQVGWNRIYQSSARQVLAGPDSSEGDLWSVSPLAGLQDGEFMYFVHSFYVTPGDSNLVLSTTRYGDIEFCSCLRAHNIFACQFHPERSGPRGLQVYSNLASLIEKSNQAEEDTND